MLIREVGSEGERGRRVVEFFFDGYSSTILNLPQSESERESIRDSFGEVRSVVDVELERRSKRRRSQSSRRTAIEDLKV